MGLLVDSSFSSLFSWLPDTFPQSLLDRKVSGIAILILAALAVYFAIKCYQEDFPSISQLCDNEVSDSSEELDELEAEEAIKKLKRSEFLEIEERVECAKTAGKLLTSFNVQDTDITDEQLQEVLLVCPNLTALDLSDCKKLTGASLNNLPSGLITLNLSGLGDRKGITDEVVKRLPRDLKELDLSKCHQLTGDIIKDLPRDLTTLSLAGMGRKLTDDAIKDLPTGLISLDLNSCFITNAGIKDLPKTLKTLLLNTNKFITDDCTKDLPRGLEDLLLRYCSHLTDTALNDLPPTLKKLNLVACWKLSKTAVIDLSKTLPNCHIVSNYGTLIDGTLLCP